MAEAFLQGSWGRGPLSVDLGVPAGSLHSALPASLGQLKMFQDEIQESSPWLKPSERGRLEQLSAGPGAKEVLGKGMGGSWRPKYHN